MINNIVRWFSPRHQETGIPALKAFLKMACVTEQSWYRNGWTIKDVNPAELDEPMPFTGRLRCTPKIDWQVIETIHRNSPCWWFEADVFNSGFGTELAANIIAAHPDKICCLRPLFSVSGGFWINERSAARLLRIMHDYDDGLLPSVPTGRMDNYITESIPRHHINYCELMSDPCEPNWQRLPLWHLGDNIHNYKPTTL
jgi:hypothetical protein